MSQPSPQPVTRQATVVRPGPTPAQLLAKVPRRAMTPEQQLAALQKVQQQAEQRVKLGQQLFQAAEARLERHQDLLGQVRKEQDKLREEVREDVASSLQTYDQWMGRIDEGFTKAMERISGRLDRVEQEVADARGAMEQMLTQAGELLQETHRLMEAVLGMPGPAEDGGTAASDLSTTPHKTPSIPPPPLADTPTSTDGPAESNTDAIFGDVLNQLRSISGED
jgi:hypothetical protein